MPAMSPDTQYNSNTNSTREMCTHLSGPDEAPGHITTCGQLLTPHQGNLRLSGPPSGQGTDGGARTHDRRIPADIRADSLATVRPTLPGGKE
ncbi:hypothetical protein PoB_007711900 [Plakobranchus ocellatus]|uniref:Uncharacterized protein n=1 Tax=Plakobranchus ocellatus TaxID=259542 RepID=A0AAV4E2Z9_9GAST|nr:hypothetical protein PoB_007711900 [Plakobranchus ocellatus]